jgi:membrane associated rhomboid family serine protease
MVREKKFIDSMTAKLIVANVAVYLLILIIGAIKGDLFALEYFALKPDSIVKGVSLWTLFTSVFSHYMFFHLFVNMFSLYFLGTFVEKLIGKKRFLIFYIIAGLFASIFAAFLSGFFAITPLLERVLGDPSVYALGASGAIFGLIGVLAVLTPRVKISFLAGPLIAIILSIFIPAEGPLSLLYILVMIYIFASLFFIMSFNPTLTRYAVPVRLEMWALPIVAIVPLVLLSIYVNLPIGNMAHLGGLIAGLIYAYYLVLKYPKRSKMIARMFT